MYKAYKYKLLPTKVQQDRLSQITGSTRWIWNYMLNLNIKHYTEKKKFTFGTDMAMLVSDLRKEHEWLKEVPAQSLQQKCIDLDRALKSVWRSQFGFPKFKSKHRSQGSFRIPQHIKFTDTHVSIPKVGKVKWRYHRPVDGQPKSMTVSRDGKHWMVSVLCEIPDIPPIVNIDKSKTIGIDLGISDFAILNNGTKIGSPTFLKKKLQKLKRIQRRLRNKKRGSNNYNKHSNRIARVHQRIRYQRLDFLHQTSRQLVNKYDVICVESLKIRDLLEKRQLSRSIADQGWSIFVEQLAYKTKLEGKHLTKIDTYLPSTKTCSSCGTQRNMKLSDRVYICENNTCPDYLKTKDRDINAAMNIHFWGLMATTGISFFDKNTSGTGGINACGDTSTNRSNHDLVSGKQEAGCLLDEM